MLNTNPRNIPEIEEVVNLGGSGQKARCDRVVHFNGGISHGVSYWLQFFVKVLQLLIDQGTKDSLDLRFLTIVSSFGNV